MVREGITIIGGGLAGSEAAWQAARCGVPVELYEMRPLVSTPAHKTGLLAELVCSNSLKSDRGNSAPWLLKEELRRSGSLLLEVAGHCSVPAGQALAVDRERFAAGVTAAIEAEPLTHIRREEVLGIPEDSIVIVATGPLTPDPLADSIQRLTGSERLFFYDSISPIVEADTIDYGKVFSASRYGKGIHTTEFAERRGDSPGGDGAGEGSEGDYLNCPLSEDEYQCFYEALLSAESVVSAESEDPNYFEACLPIEELARRGRDTLRFGPMKPVGLRDPPHGPVTLRRSPTAAGKPPRR